MSERKIQRIVQGTATKDGAGVKLVRVLSRPDVKDFDPFLMLDTFDSKNPEDYIKGFPWHPHRGIETVTYLIEGDVDHGDSMGNKGNIKKGSSQWMTAGSGVIHQEMPQASSPMFGLQLWINLPQKDKMTVPTYRDIQSHTIPEVKEDGAEVRIIAGEYKGKKGATQGEYVKAHLLDVKLDKDIAWTIDTDKEENMFIYIFLGDIILDGKSVAAKNAVLFTKGSKLSLKAGSEGARFVLFSAHPLNEGVAWGGPIVMNTEEELAHAFEELEQGTFIKHKHPKFEN